VRLSDAIAAKIRGFPESSMGAHRVALVLRDGRVVEDVQVAWASNVVRIAGAEAFDIPLEDVVDVLNRG
jgi:hypothetical protein